VRWTHCRPAKFVAGEIMKAEILSELQYARDFASLTEIVLVICAPFGPVRAFSIAHDKAARVVSCFIETESAKQHPAMARALGGTLVSGAVCLEIPVDSGFVSSRRMHLISPIPEGDSPAGRR
jgi:hypothetical protein